MIRLISFFVIVALLAGGAVWLADQPGSVALNWQTYEIRISVLAATIAGLVGFALLYGLLRLIRRILGAPKAVGRAIRKRRQKKGYQALTRGLIAASNGHGKLAEQLSHTARKLLPDEPLTLLLQAQTAQIKGGEASAAKVFRTMLDTPETQVLGLRGLFTQARKEGRSDVARTIAAQAVKLEPDSPWASAALLELQSSEGSWLAAEQTLELQKRHKLISKAQATRLRAVILTAQAMEKENTDPDAALALAREAHKLAPGLVPAAVLAGRLLAQQGKVSRAAKLIEKTWALMPHPDLAEVYAHLRMGDKPPARLKRIQTLVAKTPGHKEAAMALARAAIEAREWEQARQALEPLLEEPAQNACLLMAQIEDGEFGDKGRAREWLSRALRARRDPIWIAGGFEAESWAPVSPLTGQLDTFEWKVPQDSLPPAAPVLDEVPAAFAEADKTAEDTDSGEAGDTKEAKDAEEAMVEILPPPSADSGAGKTAADIHVTTEPKPKTPSPDGKADESGADDAANDTATTAPESEADAVKTKNDDAIKLVKPVLHQPDDPGPLPAAKEKEGSSLFGLLRRPDS